MPSDKLDANASAELLARHYQESFSEIRQLEKERNRLFIYLVSAVALTYLTAVEAIQAVRMVSGLSERLLGAEFSITLGVLQASLWAILLWLTMRYFQVAVHIERQYDYLHDLENLLNSFFPGTMAFTREGESYLRNYPTFRYWVWVFYSWLFPILLAIVVSLRGVIEWTTVEVGIVQHIFDSVLCAAILLTDVLYLACIHCRKAKKSCSTPSSNNSASVTPLGQAHD